MTSAKMQSPAMSDTEFRIQRIELASSSDAQAAVAPPVVAAPTDDGFDDAPAAGISGSLDACGPRRISGWLYDARDADNRLDFEVLADGVPVADGMASHFRQDLLEAGIGDGKYSFDIPIPATLFDDQSHTIEVRELRTGFLLAGCPRTLRASRGVQGDMRLAGSALEGSCVLMDTTCDLDELELIDNGEVTIGGHAWLDRDVPGLVRFRVPVPRAAFDGRPHGFEVRLREDAVSLGSAAMVMPQHLTPEESLLRHAREGMKPALAVAAGFRYEALSRSLEALASEGSRPGADLPGIAARISQLHMAHARLVRGFNAADTDFAPLAFPVVDHPVASIVIPIHNKFHVTYHCLLSLLVAPNRASFEVIIVDDGSKDDSIRVPELVSGIQYLRNEEAQGFILACNRGASVARGDYIVMLNNDTEVTAGWIDELLASFEHFDGVGMAGAKLLYPDGTLQEAGGIVWSSGNPWNYGRKANPADPRYCYARQADYLSGACVMLPRELWNDIGGFSETYIPAYFEDTDLAFQVRERGFKTVYTPFSQIIHFEGVSSGTSVSSGIKRFQEINRPKFKGRWIGACRNNGKEGVGPDLAKDRNIEFRALVIDAETPMPDQNAGSYAAIQEMRMLQALGFKCTFVPQNMAYMGRYTETLQRMGIECVYSPFAASVNDLIEERGAEFDLVYITRYYVAQECIDTIRKHAPNAKVVLMNADLHFLRELRAAVNSKIPEDLAKAVDTRKTELAVMQKADLVLTYTELEKAVILSHNLDSTRVARCPWVCETSATVPAWDTRRDIAFLGGYNHAPNVEAVEWFVARVMPLISASLPGVNFRIYGSKVPQKLIDLAEKHDNVIVEGWVADVADVYDHCRVFVAPLQSGAGIKGKVIGALAHGVPCVLSQIAAEGIPLGDGAEAAIAGKPEDWAQAITRLYGAEDAWNAMSARAMEFTESHYGFTLGVREMQAALQDAELFTTLDNRSLAYR